MKHKLLTLAASIFLGSAAFGQTYNFYFGNIHSQTSYSDGNQDSVTSGMTTPLQGFAYARASQHIDFYGISDHNHASAGQKGASYYHKGIADADSANQDGSFVAMYGFEYGVITGGGHVIVYGTDKLWGWDTGDDVFNGEFDYAGVFTKVNALPVGFAYLCHPEPGDYNGLVSTAPYSVSADSAVVGSCSRSGPAFSTNNTYSTPSSGSYIPQWQNGLAKGYHLGIGLDHDTHNSVFGRQSAGRLVVLAPALTRANIYTAFKKRHFYSSDDWNAQATFTINTQIMGSVFQNPGNPVIHVSVMDPDSEAVDSIQVFYGVPGSGSQSTVLQTNYHSTSFDLTPAMPDGSTFYYYAVITQADGDVIWTSPIWYTRNDFPLDPPVAGISNPGSLLCTETPINLADSSAHVPTTWAWSFPGAVTASSSVKNPTVTYATAGTYTISLTATNANGTSATSRIVTVLASPAIPLINQNGNMLSTAMASSYQWYFMGYALQGAVSQTYNATQSGNLSVCVTNPVGCSACSAVLSFTAGIAEEDPTEGSLLIFPNPNDGNFSIRYTLVQNQNLTVSILDLSGRLVYETKATGMTGQNLLNVSNTSLAKGVYLIQFASKEGMGTRKLVVN